MKQGWRLLADSGMMTKPMAQITIEQHNDGFVLKKDGHPCFIKGARTISKKHVDLVGRIGGNSIRIGGRDPGEELDEAHRHGLGVLVGLPVQAERNGFDYNNAQAVAQQLAEIKEIVERWKSHPAVLLWAIGNEMDFIPGDSEFNLKLWDAINDIARMIHAVDPDHPAITVIGTGRKPKLTTMAKMLPDIDALGANSYGDIGEVPQWVRSSGWNRPYLLTEWGPTGDWQVRKNKWRMSIEETTTEKAAVYLQRHQQVIGADPWCLGGYSFLWTQGRQERTHTWYNLFHDTGESTEAVDVMEYLWTGKWPAVRAPRMLELTVASLTKEQDISLSPGQSAEALVVAEDPNGETLCYEWELYPEGKKFGYAGHGERRPIPQNDRIAERKSARTTFTVPDEPGGYRLFIYVRNGQKKIAMGNVPFYVE